MASEMVKTVDPVSHATFLMDFNVLEWCSTTCTYYRKCLIQNVISNNVYETENPVLNSVKKTNL